MTTTDKSLIPRPDDFDGTEYKKFKRQIFLYLQANRKHLQDDEDKIALVLGHMKKGVAAEWAGNYMDTHQMAAVPVPESYVDFMAKLDLGFTNPNEQPDAQAKLSSLRQGSKTVEEFFLEFDTLRRLAGYASGHDAYLIELLEKALHREIITTIYASDTLPTTFDSWRKKATNIGGLQQRLHRITKSTWAPRPNTTTQHPRPTAPGHTSSPVNDRRDATGTTFGGMGQKMDVSKARAEGRCFKCGEQGHISRFCPARGSTRVRSLLVGMSAEEKELLRKELWKETADEQAGFQGAPAESPAAGAQ